MSMVPPDSANTNTRGAAPPGGRQVRPLVGHPAFADRAIELLASGGALADLTAEEAACIVAYMGLLAYPAGAAVLREGDATNTSYMLLILGGEVSVETADPLGAGQVPISVLGAGSVIGEMGLIDGSARSASCVAATPLQAASLTRNALQQLIDEHPKVGAKLMTGLCVRLADRLRGLGEQLQLYARLNASLQQQLDRLRPRAG